MCQKHFIVHCAKKRGENIEEIKPSMTNIYTVGTTVLFDIINCDIGTTEFYGVQLCSLQLLYCQHYQHHELTLGLGQRVSSWSIPCGLKHSRTLTQPAADSHNSSLPQSLTDTLTASLTHSILHSLIQCFPYTFSASSPQLVLHSFIQFFTHTFDSSLTHSMLHSFIHSILHSHF
jgi:hypothetical protein